MSSLASIPARHFFAPEIIQTSAMDCGPASLKCLLNGFDIPVNYGRLREACQTDVDGTSIDTLEDLANQLGLNAEQIVVPSDHLFIPTARTLPAIVVVRLPNGFTHFVVVWNQVGSLVQVMDPGTGRRWLTQREFLNQVYVHSMIVPAADWRAYAGSESFCNPLRERLAKLRIDTTDATSLVDDALRDPTWFSLAALDAATRMVDALARSGGLQRGAQAHGALAQFLQNAHQTNLPPPEPGATAHKENLTIPPIYWSVTAATDAEHVLMRGAVLVRALQRREKIGQPESATTNAPSLPTTLAETPSDPERHLWNALRADGVLTPSVLIFALALATGAVMIEAFLMRGILDAGRILGLVGQRIDAALFFFVFLLALLLLELPILGLIQRIGRRLETDLRVAFLEKLPRLSDRYFHSRLTSDMAQRAHDLRQLRALPTLGVTLIRLTMQIALTALGVVWLTPHSAPIALLATLFAFGWALLTQPILQERDLRVRTHTGTLSRFYLDALLGLTPLRAHSAERAFRREHELLLGEWVSAGMRFARVEMIVQAINAITQLGFVAWILFDYAARQGSVGELLLLFYWTLNLPVLGQQLAETAKQYPAQRNRVARLLEPLDAPEESAIVQQYGGEIVETQDNQLTSELAHYRTNTPGVAIEFQDVSVQVGGHVILSNINLAIEPGEQIAIVGASGAGKSTLVGVLLGWHRPATGQVLVANAPLDGNTLPAVRRATAWVDPSVQLWNRSLFDNLRYGAPTGDASPFELPLEQIDLFELMQKLPNGLQTALGESGRLVSGGEGQRVRLGRMMVRSGIRLVILDEAFRGLDRQKRSALLARARAQWQAATMVCVTHDVAETLAFDRVIVMDGGQIVEEGKPQVLQAQAVSRYRAMLDAAEATRRGLWANATWRRLWIENGTLKE